MLIVKEDNVELCVPLRAEEVRGVNQNKLQRVSKKAELIIICLTGVV